jgi:DNA-binding beta-propeller fold protein YncE
MSLTQLSFTFGQATPPSLVRTIYISTDARKNQLVLVLETNTAGTTFAPGDPVPQSAAAAAANSLLYLDLAALDIGETDFAKLSATAAGWTIKPYPADRQLCLTPDGKSQTLAPGSPLRVAIDGFTLANPPTVPDVTLTLTSYHVPNVTVGSLGMPVTSKSLLQQPPGGGGDLHAALHVEVLNGGGVVCSDESHPGVQNTLQLVLTATQAPAATAKTSFTLTFVYAPEDDPYGYGALTTASAAMAFDVNRGPGSDEWTITPPKDQQNPSWLLLPPAGVIEGTLEFEIGEVVTALAAGPTLAILAYSGFAEYADGAYVLDLEKYAHAEVSSFTVDPDWAVLSDGEANVTLSWEASNYRSLTIGYDDVTHDQDYPTQIESTTVFTLLATGTEPGGTPNTASRDVTAHVLPVINEFVALPATLYAKDFSRSVTFAWNVNTNDEVQLDINGVDTTHPPRSWTGQVLNAPQMVTLVPTGDPTDPLVRRKLVVSAFDAAPPTLSRVPSGATHVAIAPTTGFVLVSDPGSPTVVALDTLVYGQAGSAHVGTNPGGLCFSPDGSVLYAVASGDGTVSAFKTSLGSTAPLTYTLTALGSPLAVGGAPQEVTTSPDGRYVYVTIDNGSNKGSLAILKAASDGTLSQAQSPIPVGVGPRGVATTASGARIYVANSGEGTVSLIGVGAGGHHSAGVPIRGVTGRPTGVAVTRPSAGKDDTGGVLLVTCADAGTVVAIDTEHAGTALRKTLTVGSKPQGVALVPGGAYAAVANSGDGTVSLLGLAPTPPSCTVVEKAISAAAGVTGIAVSPDGGLVVAASPQDKSVVALDLVQYVQQEDSLDVVTQPTEVAVSADGTHAVVWHDALKKFFKGQPSTGVSVYDMQSQTATPQLAHQPVTALVFHPSPPVALAFVTTQGNAYVEVVDTKRWQPVNQLDLGSLTDGQPRALAVSADGTTLFALAGDASRNYDLIAMRIAPRGALTAIGTAVRAFTAIGIGASGLACTPDASAAYALDGFDGKVWPVVRGDGGYALLETPVAIGGQGAAIAIAPDGLRLFVLGRTPGQPQFNILVSIALPSLEMETTLLPSVNDAQLGDLAVSPDGTRLFVTDALNTGIQVFDAASLRLVQMVSWSSSVQLPLGVAVTPDGSQLFTANVNSNDLAVAQQVQPA